MFELGLEEVKINSLKPWFSHSGPERSSIPKRLREAVRKIPIRISKAVHAICFTHHPLYTRESASGKWDSMPSGLLAAWRQEGSCHAIAPKDFKLKSSCAYLHKEGGREGMENEVFKLSREEV